MTEITPLVLFLYVFLAQLGLICSIEIFQLNIQSYVFLRISQISQEMPRPAILLKKKLQHWCFPVKFAKLLS